MSLLPFEVEGALRQAADFLRRHIKSKAVREAERRRVERRSRAFGRRMRQSMAAGGVAGAGMFAVTMATAPAGPGLIAVGVAALVTATAVLSWPRRRPAEGPLSAAELQALPAEAEDWLLDQRVQLPAGASPAFDAILVHLGDIQAAIAAVNPASTLAWETRRLLGDHLPNLIHAYCALPAAERNADKEHQQRLITGLDTLAEEMARLSREVNRDRLLRFETHGRFIESRYKEPDGARPIE